MTDFDEAILGSYLVSGYKYILYYNLDHFAILAPCDREIETGDNAYLLPINDEQVFEMANGVEDFSFYVQL